MKARATGAGAMGSVPRNPTQDSGTPRADRPRFGALGCLLAVSLALAPVPSTTAQQPSEAKGGRTPDPGLETESAVAQGPSSETSAAGPDQPGRLGVELSAPAALVGDRITATLIAVWMGREPAGDARFPTWQETWGGAEVLDASEPESMVDGAGRHVYRQEVVLTAWKAGTVELPPAEVVIPLADEAVTLRGQPARFEITSLLPAKQLEGGGEDAASTSSDPGPEAAGNDAGSGDTDAAGDEGPAALVPRPFAGPENLDRGRIPFLTSTAALALLLAMSLVQLQRRLADQGEVQEEAGEAPDPLLLLPPLDELLERLSRVSAEEAVPAHTALSLALRRLLARRLSFPAVESTTTEIRSHLSRQTLPSELVQSTLGLLQACDLVKFAGISVEAPVTAQRLEETRSLGRRIDELFRPRLPPQPASAGAASVRVARDRAASRGAGGDTGPIPGGRR
ncbi:MAG: hypothetical protein MI919_43100 [Holophagales bacterium]|nr:hypothetical protein [Holophagales bacterium]